MLRSLIAGALAVSTIAAVPAAAAVELVQNGDFSQTVGNTGSIQMSNGSTQYVTGWTSASSGYNFVIKSDPTVGNSIQTNQNGTISLWGKNNAGGDSVAYNNGLSESVAGRGNFLAADGAYGVSPIYQLITGLTVGQTYTLSFDWAGAQQKNYDGATTEAWYFGLGTDINNFNTFDARYTGAVNNVSHGFTGWQTTSATFTATSANEYLAFMANGTPSGEPPFSLLDNVSLKAQSAVPEPATWVMMIGGFGFVGYSLRRRRTTVSIA
jgi:hypothetical protein